MVPEVELPPLLPSTCQVTPAFEGSLKTLAANCTGDEDRVTAARLGLSTTVRTPGVTVIVAEADFAGSPMEVAVRVTVAGLGMFVGAVYVTDVVVNREREPQALPLHPGPESDQVTPLLWKSLL